MVRGSIPYQNLAEKEDEQRWPFLFFEYNRAALTLTWIFHNTEIGIKTPGQQIKMELAQR